MASDLSGPASDPHSVDRRALRDQVYDRILDLLLSGAMEPSARLGIDTLARDLNVSPTPVREALAHLERTGLVSREALRGYRVAPPLDRSQVTELFDARQILETGAARIAEQHSDALLPGLRAAHAHHVELADALAESGGGVPDIVELHRYFDADWGFHRVILEHSRNHFLIEMSESLGSHVHRMRQSAAHGELDVELAVAEHADVLAAFESNVPGSAEAAMATHIRRVRERALADA